MIRSVSGGKPWIKISKQRYIQQCMDGILGNRISLNLQAEKQEKNTNKNQYTIEVF